MKRFERQNAVVTGASSGIGRSIALALAEDGARVVLAARREGMLQEVAQEIKSGGGTALVMPTDVTRQDHVKELVQGTLEAWGQIDIVVANAGAYYRKPIRRLQVQDVERSMDVNFYGGLRLVLEALPHFLDRKRGRIALMTTLDAKICLPPDTPYVVAKSALASFGDVLRQEVAHTNISVTTIYPGRVDTPMIENLRFRWISKKISPRDVAEATLRGMHRGQAEVIIPWTGRVLHYIRTLFPRWGDSLARTFELQGWPEIK